MARIVELSQVPGNPYGEYYTEEDNMDIRRLITEHQTAVDVLDTELERLSRINAELLRKRSKHSNLIQKGKFALSPHSKLPLEIIKDIILYASCSMITIPFKWEIDTARSKRRILPTQVILAQVCSAWRKVAFSNPQLWSHFMIGCFWSRKDITLEIILELSSRSRGLPITLITTLSELPSQAFQALIMSHQPFLELKLTLSEKQLLQFYQFPTEACANLEVLSFLIPDPDIWNEMSVDFHPDKYPRLKSLTIRRKGGSALRISVIPWSQLTTLRLHPVRSSQLNMLRQCVSLEECDLRIKWGFIDGVGEIHLPCLLRFRVTGNIKNLSFLRVFRFPNLEEFEGHELRMQFLEDHQQLMLDHFNLPRIRVLKIPDWRTRLDFDALLKLAPCLESVSLPEPKDETPMQELATGALGPSLHSIETQFDWTCEQALTFAETRWECVDASNASGSSTKIVPFKRIEFRAINYATPDDLERRYALQKRGTVIEWDSQ